MQQAQVVVFELKSYKQRCSPIVNVLNFVLIFLFFNKDYNGLVRPLQKELLVAERVSKVKNGFTE